MLSQYNSSGRQTVNVKNEKRDRNRKRAQKCFFFLGGGVIYGVGVCFRQEVKRVMEKTLTDLQIPMDIADECILQREKRTDIDQTHDEVEKCLSKVSEGVSRVRIVGGFGGSTPDIF